MKRLLGDWGQALIMAVMLMITDVILPWVICSLPAIGVAYIATFFTSNECFIFAIGLCVYIAIAILLVLLVKRYEDKQKNSQEDTRE